MNLPAIKLGPKPKAWDLIAAVVMTITVLAAGANWVMAQKPVAGSSLSSGTTLTFVLLQVVLASVSLFILGKTATEGTLWGNLAAVGGMLIGLSGILLAAAMSIAA